MVILKLNLRCYPTNVNPAQEVGKYFGEMGLFDHKLRGDFSRKNERNK